MFLTKCALPCDFGNENARLNARVFVPPPPASAGNNVVPQRDAYLIIAE